MESTGNGHTFESIKDLRERNRRVEDRMEALRVELGERMDRIEERQLETLTAVSALKVQAGIWGGLAGLIGAATVLAALVVKG